MTLEKKDNQNTDSKSSIPTETPNTQTSAPSIEEITKNAQIVLASITGFAESAKVAAAAAMESNGLAAKVLSDTQAKLVECTTTVTQAMAARTKILDEQAVIATKSDHIQKAQEHADKVRADLDRALTAAMKQVTDVEGYNIKAQSAAESATQLLADVRTAKGAIDTDGVAVVTARKAAETAMDLIKGLAEKTTEVEANLAAYEKRLNELNTQCATQLKTIESLLPGATSAGLASSFDDRRKAFLKPQNRWQWLFVGSVLAIVAVTFTSFLHGLQTAPPTYEELVRLWLTRLPLIGALVWLGMHASHEAALAKRLEEDYGYKAAISSCFEGFKEQMSAIDTGVAANSALAALLKNTLDIIATPPGRIYEKHALAVSPTSEFTEAAKAATDFSLGIKKIK